MLSAKPFCVQAALQGAVSKDTWFCGVVDLTIYQLQEQRMGGSLLAAGRRLMLHCVRLALARGMEEALHYQPCYVKYELSRL